MFAVLVCHYQYGHFTGPYAAARRGRTWGLCWWTLGTCESPAQLLYMGGWGQGEVPFSLNLQPCKCHCVCPLLTQWHAFPPVLLWANLTSSQEVHTLGTKARKGNWCQNISTFCGSALVCKQRPAAANPKHMLLAQKFILLCME